MRTYHRHSFFPLVIILLTLLLGAFMAVTLNRESVPAFSVQEVMVPVDGGLYHDELVNLLTTFQTDFSLASTDGEKLVVTEQAFMHLLSLRVPLEGKQMHLELALLLTKIQTVLKSEVRDPSVLLDEIQAIKETL
jgi:hypothetical protein